MPTLGSDGGFQADNRGGIIDDQGNTIVTSETTFAASPLGIAARTQALYGIPNANFNLTPPDPDSPIVANQNDLPYWSIEDLSDGNITATTVFDGTTQTWGVELNPGTAATDSSLSLSTRSYVLTDDNLALRQKALSVISKSGTAGGTASQWNLQLSAIYYDANDTALSTAVIGTALDTGTWTSFSGTTTPGGSAINSAAQYVDLTYTLTTTAAVTGSAKATIKSLLLTTTSPTTGGGLLVAETFTTSGTWTRPTGVDYLVAVAGYGAGGGGAMGRIIAVSGTAESECVGGSGGGGGGWAIVRDLYVGNVSSVSVGIGAGGAGGGTTLNFVGTTIAQSIIAGANGGATTFGSYLNIPGGGGGGTTTTINTVGGGGSAGATVTSGYFGFQQLTAGGGGPGRNGGTASAGTSAAMAYAADGLPYTVTSTGGAAGGSASYSLVGTVSSTVGTTGVKAGGGSSYSGGGGQGDGIALNISDNATYSLHTGTATAGGGGGGRAYWVRGSGTLTSGTVFAGSGGNGAFGGGGGGSGGAGVRTVSASRISIKGQGGNGSDGYLTVVYIA